MVVEWNWANLMKRFSYAIAWSGAFLAVLKVSGLNPAREKNKLQSLITITLIRAMKVWHIDLTKIGFMILKEFDYSVWLKGDSSIKCVSKASR
jgi:hypothetical protein